MKKLSIAAAVSFSVSQFCFAQNLMFPENAKVTFSKEDASSSFKEITSVLGLALSGEHFKLQEIKSSLLGEHYYFQQTQDGFEVEGAQLVVTVSGENIIKVYDSTLKVEVSSMKASIPFISHDEALSIAWKKIEGNGELLERPQAMLVYDREMRLVYHVNLSSSSPFGHWRVTVDAQTGRALSTEDAAIPRMKRGSEITRLRGPQKSFKSVLRSFEMKEQKKLFKTALSFTKGAAQVFDPNPVVTLGRTDLNDSTPLSEFLPAYRTQDLLDISFDNGVYSLTGPKVTLIDFESPRVAPSTSPDGTWMHERQDPKFNDAMTYLHLDRSMRYIEGLGFSGPKAIFPKSIEVDANGLSGQDNSHYIPYSKRLAFGSGCVDDNQDADVILHELGHAIQDHINSSWGGGDTGAMGEGFGDYWAASYSVTTEHGMDTHPEWVFKFDGHNECWPGRKLDSINPKYDPKRTYSAHSTVNGGISDEVWSTPLFQAFLELHGRGVSRDDIDQVILESHYGLGYGLKMPQMAESVVRTAKRLFPSTDYDQVFLKHFKNQNILQ